MKGLSRLRIGVGGSIVTVVPAVHYRVAFAELVNAISRDPESRPDSIAVESPPSMTLQVAQWLRELEVGPKKRTPLPCLLGLVARQRYVSPKLRDRAFALQLQYGCDLHELPPAVLDRELSFRQARLLPLSPTDSIIEAIRCAAELDVPVYGIDLEVHAAIESDDRVFPDVSTPASRLSHYLEDWAEHANALGVCEISSRRELAMAARLKELLDSYRHVLFTCGLAHWKRIVDLVVDPTVRRTSNVFSLALRRNVVSARRTLIDPSLAFQFLDRLPAVAASFERRRRHPLLDAHRRRAKSVSVPRLYDRAIRRGMQIYLESQSIGDSGRECLSGRFNRLVDFPRRALTYGALGLNEVPSVTQTLRCAKSFVSEEFAASLGKTLLKFRWAASKDFPDCAVMRGADHLYGSKALLRIKRGGVLPEPVVISGIDEPEWIGIEGGRPPRERRTSRGLREGYRFTWTPWEHLVTGLSDDAIMASLAQEALRIAEPFRGSTGRKIAWKETLRGRLRGDYEFYIYGEPSVESLQPPDSSEGWPVIWIFDSGDRGTSEWKHYIVPMPWITPYFDEATRRSIPGLSSNGILSTLICFGDEDKTFRADSLGHEVQASMLRGIIVYGPVFNLNQQYARWLELTSGLHNPCLPHDAGFGLPRPLAERCEALGTALGTLRWQDDIVRLAVPYGGRQITVVRPRSLKLDAAVYREAAAARKRLVFVDLEQFAGDDIERVQSNLMVPGVADGGGQQYSADAEAAIAEDRLRYADRMPDKWMTFGL